MKIQAGISTVAQEIPINMGKNDFTVATINNAKMKLIFFFRNY